MTDPICSSRVYRVRDIDQDDKAETVIEDNVCRRGDMIVSGEQRMVLSSGRTLSNLKSILNGKGDKIAIGQTACNSHGTCFELNRMDDFFVTDPPYEGAPIQDYVDMLVRVTDETTGGKYLMDVNTLKPEGWVERCLRRYEPFVVGKVTSFIAFVFDAARAVKSLF